MARTINQDHASHIDPAAPVSVGAAPSFVWSDARLLGFGPMDSTHEEFYQVTFALMTSDEKSATQRLAVFESHALSHFEQEAEWMKASAFPGMECHLDEHSAVLQTTTEIRRAFESGNCDVATVHDFAIHLFSWFPGHADFMDSALASWMTQKKHGGRPVVLRRSLQR
jgi:hemerythrin-like metal-binding protein